MKILTKLFGGTRHNWFDHGLRSECLNCDAVRERETEGHPWKMVTYHHPHRCEGDNNA